MGIKSINEPEGPGHIVMVTPVSINEPPVAPPPPPEIEPPQLVAHHHAIDPDDLEDEIDEAVEDGDIKPLHPPRKKGRR